MAKILLVEDNELNRDMLSRRLRRRGYELSIAVDGAEAIAIASAQSFDLILMDMSLPVMDGWEATRRLKAQAHTQKVPIIALTAHAMRGDRDQALAAGCDDYDTKPIDLKRLLSKIKSFLSSEQLADASDKPKPVNSQAPATAPVVPIKPVTPITTPAVFPITASTSERPITPIDPAPLVSDPIAAEAWRPIDSAPSPSAIPAEVDDDPWTSPVQPSVTAPGSDSWGPQIQSSIVISEDETSVATTVSEFSSTPETESAAIINPDSDSTVANVPRNAASERRNNIFRGLPILVVDDNEDNRDMLSRRLTRRGYEAVVVESGEAALDYIATHPEVALVLLDIMMPGIDGIETLKRIRQDYSRNQLPVLMVTAKAQSDDMVKAFELGANDYITKPIDFAVTLARVETQLSIVKATKTTSTPVKPTRSTPTAVTAPDNNQIRHNEVLQRSEPQPVAANISLVPKNGFSRFAAERYQVQYFLRQ
ncbi:MAG: response regulator, partial [Cyanobacteria bacterium P01_D01_bin.56]